MPQFLPSLSKRNRRCPYRSVLAAARRRSLGILGKPEISSDPDQEPKPCRRVHELGYREPRIPQFSPCERSASIARGRQVRDAACPLQREYR